MMCQFVVDIDVVVNILDKKNILKEFDKINIIFVHLKKVVTVIMSLLNIQFETLQGENLYVIF